MLETLTGFDIAESLALLGALGYIVKLLFDRRKSNQDFTAKLNSATSEAIAAATGLFERLCAQYGQRIDQLHRDIGAAETRIGALENQNSSLRRENEELKRQLCDLQDLLADGEEERKRLQTEVDALTARLAIYEKRPATTRRATAK